MTTTSILVDTHYVIWLRLSPQRLTSGERRIIDEAPLRHVSIVSLWEIAILLGRRRLAKDDELLEVPDGFGLLTVDPQHCRTVLDLPTHHQDPFDRMLVAQARSEGIALLTRDRALGAYSSHATILHNPRSRRTSSP